MSDQSEKPEMLTVQSSRFGELSVPADSVIEFPQGVIGFPDHKDYIMIEHKPPFCWLHSVTDPNLAFVVVDGLEFGENYKPAPPIGDENIELQEGDEFAILVIVTVRPDPTMTTANLKAPVFVNLNNRKGVQIIFDNPKLTTRFPLWAPAKEAAEKEEAEAGKKKDEG